MAIENLVSSFSGLFMTIMRIVVIAIIAIGGFFGARMFVKQRNQKKSFNITAFVTNPDGSHMILKTGKFKDKDGMQKMLFLREMKGFFGRKSWVLWKGESMSVINPKEIVSRTVQLFRYGPSQYAVIPPTVYRELDVTKQFGIRLINMHMLEFKGLEQRAAISRWANIKKGLAEWAPYITFVIIAITAGVAVYFLVKLGSTEFAKLTAARVAECSNLLGGGSAPAGV